MRGLSVAALAVLMVVCVSAARAQDDNAKKIVGVWEVVKSTDLPTGSTVEFTKDLKIVAIAKMDGNDFKVDGTYKVEKDKLMIKIKISDQMTVEETATIKKLTDDALEVEDKDKKVDTFKRKK
jgi:uncharacterized protein (TIGR03066 family)